MDEATFQSKLSALMTEIESLPESEQGRLKEMAQETQDRHQKLRKTVKELQESLDYLRLSVKYLVFDLEATRRENRYLRQLVEENQTSHNEDADHHQDDAPEFE